MSTGLKMYKLTFQGESGLRASYVMCESLKAAERHFYSEVNKSPITRPRTLIKVEEVTGVSSTN